MARPPAFRVTLPKHGPKTSLKLKRGDVETDLMGYLIVIDFKFQANALPPIFSYCIMTLR
jgi:hypothetical protein